MNNIITHDNIKYNPINFNTGSCGRFYTYLNKEHKLLYKYARITQIKTEMINTEKFIRYKNIIEKAEEKEIVGKYLINGRIIKENCGDYIIRYVDGHRFDHLYRIDDIDLLNKIKEKIDIFVEDLKLADKKKLLYGDWGIQNIIYDIENHKIFNIDTEGLYTYPRLPRWCKIDKIIENIYESLYSNPLMKSFTAIIWNNGLHNKDKILEMIPNIITSYPFSIKKENLHETIFDIYSMDKRCDRDLLPKKIDFLKKCNEEHLIIKFLINKPQFNNRNISYEAVNMKKNIRKQFSNIIHVADNYEESDYIWNKYSPAYMFDVYIKKFSNKTKIISKDKLDDNDGVKVDIISVFNGNFKHSNPLIQYYCYKKSDNNYYFSNSSTHDASTILCFSFFCTRYMVEKFLR